MAFIPALNGLKWFINMTVGGKSCGFTGWVFDPIPGDTAHQTALGNKLTTWLTASLMPLLANNVLALGWEVSDQSLASGGVSSFTYTTPLVGGTSGNALPVNVAFCLTLQTASRGRSYRGRMYIPGAAVGENGSPTTWLSTYVNAMESAGLALPAEINSGSQYLVIASHFQNKLPRTSALLTAVTAVRANARIASQRRRTGR